MFNILMEIVSINQPSFAVEYIFHGTSQNCISGFISISKQPYFNVRLFVIRKEQERNFCRFYLIDVQNSTVK